MNNRVFAFLGKGGTGKTALSTLFGIYLINNGKRPLFIDADPAGGIQKTLGLENVPSIASARQELIALAKKASRINENNASDFKMTKEDLDYIIMNTVIDQKDFGFIAIGQNMEPGCFCSINNLLKSTLHAILPLYDVIIIDAEAGLEQVYRQVVEEIHVALMVSDVSKRGIDTCVSLKHAIEKIEGMKTCSYGAVINKTKNVPELHTDFLHSEGINVLGTVDLNAELADFDMRGESLLNIKKDNAIFREIESFAKKILN